MSRTRSGAELLEQTLGGAERAAHRALERLALTGAAGDVLAEDDDRRVDAHGVGQGVADRFEERERSLTSVAAQAA